MAHKVVLITGCSSGIGLSTAVRIARDATKKFTVYSTMRNLKRKEKLEEMAGSTLNDTMFIRELDVDDDRSVSEAVKNIVSEHGRIDVVVNNAGVTCSTPTEYISTEKAKEIFNTNFFGTLRTLKAVLPTMKERKSGQVINVSTIGGYVGYPFYDIYAASKFAVEGLTESLQARLEAFGIRFTLVCPGAVDTDLMSGKTDNALQVEELDATTREQHRAFRSQVRFHFKEHFQTTNEIADIIHGLLELPEGDRTPFRLPTSEYARDMLSIKHADPDFEEARQYLRYFLSPNDGTAFGKQQQNTK